MAAAEPTGTPDPAGDGTSAPAPPAENGDVGTDETRPHQPDETATPEAGSGHKREVWRRRLDRAILLIPPAALIVLAVVSQLGPATLTATVAVAITATVGCLLATTLSTHARAVTIAISTVMAATLIVVLCLPQIRRGIDRHAAVPAASQSHASAPNPTISASASVSTHDKTSPVPAGSATPSPAAAAPLVRAGQTVTQDQVRDVSLTDANLDGATLSGLVLPQRNLNRAQLVGAVLHGMDLAGASLVGANLTGADLAGANLAGACLRGADLSAANLTGTVLAGADITGARLPPASAGAPLRPGQIYLTAAPSCQS